jgi:hypothetical protein
MFMTSMHRALSWWNSGSRWIVTDGVLMFLEIRSSSSMRGTPRTTFDALETPAARVKRERATWSE